MSFNCTCFLLKMIKELNSINIIRKPKSLKDTLLLLFLFVASLAHAQFEAQTSQYMFNLPAFNAAAMAENGMVNVAGQHRIQWVGMPGAPQTTYFNINTPFVKGEKITHATGVKFLNDGIGAFNNTSAHLQYALKRKVGKGTVSLGLDAGFVSASFIADSIKNVEINSEFHDFLGDTAIPTADETGMSFDMGASLFYSAPKYYLGLSYVHLNAPTIRLNEDKTEFKVRSVLYFTGAYDWHFKESKWKLRNTTLAKSDFISWQAEVASRLEYDSRFWGGLAYRFQDAVSVFAGIDVMDGVRIGYAYDLPAGRMIRASSGSHEVFISYSFLFDKGNKNSYKSIRIL